MIDISIPEMLTLKETSDRTGLSYEFLRKLCLRGEIVFIKTGTKYLVNLPKLIEFLNGGESMPTKSRHTFKEEN